MIWVDIRWTRHVSTDNVSASLQTRRHPEEAIDLRVIVGSLLFKTICKMRHEESTHFRASARAEFLSCCRVDVDDLKLRLEK